MADIPPGYQEGSTEVYDPETGVRKRRTFYYQPSQPTGYQLPQGFAQGVQDAYANMPLKDAERAVSAAIQYQGLRGYQQDLASGMPASEALIRNAPSMFYQRPQAIAPTMRAVMPPTMTPYQQGMLDLNKQKFEYSQQQSKAPKFINIGGVGYRQEPDGTLTAVTQPVQKPIQPTAAERSQIRLTESEIKDLRKNAPELVPPKSYLWGAINRPGNKEEVDAYNKQIAEKMAQIERLGGGIRQPVQTVQTNSPTAAGTPVAAAPTAPKQPFQEGAVIRNKSNGKLYKVTNGVPVPVE